MSNWLELPNLVMSACALLLMLQGLLVLAIMPVIDKWNKHFFVALFIVIVLCDFAYLADTIVYMYPNMALAEKIAVYFESLLSSLLMPMLTVHILHSCGENWRKSILLRAVIAVWVVYFILLQITQFTTFIYYLTPDNQYFRGPLYPLILVPPVTIMILNLTAVIRRRKKLSAKSFAADLICLLVPTVAMLIQMFAFGLLFIELGMTISAILMFCIILSDQIEQGMRQQQEIAHQRASIMVLQMRPHFIYNTMMSIYYLCEQDPKKAQQVTLDFTTYLRKNFTAIAEENTVPFSEELKHTRAYLAVELAQFEDSLFVDYDTQHTHFRVPPLTLQPIVENAVKHGMDQDSEPLCISIKTRKTNSGSEIIVENNGYDFEPADDKEPHIALHNIEQRLKMMCGGEIIITPRKGGGTVVKMTIPK